MGDEPAPGLAPAGRGSIPAGAARQLGSDHRPRAPLPSPSLADLVSSPVERMLLWLAAGVFLIGLILTLLDLTENGEMVAAKAPTISPFLFWYDPSRYTRAYKGAG